MDADEIGRALRILRKPRDRQGRGIGGEDRAFGQHGFDRLDDRFLHLAILEHRLDDEVGIGEIGVIGRWRDAGEQRCRLILRKTSLTDRILDQTFADGLALGGRFHVAVDQGDRNAGGGRDIGDRGAHEAGADDADMFQLGLGDAGRAAGALAEFLHGDEQRADHREGFAGLQHLGEITLLDLQAGVERHLQAFIDAFQDGECCRIIARCFAAQDCGRGRPELGRGRRPDAAARRLEALLVPGGDRLQAILDHLLGGGDELIRLDHLMHEVHRLGAGAGQRRACRHHLQRILGVRQPRDTLRAAGAGEDADLDLRQRDLDALGIRGDAAVAGERHFESAAHAGAVDGGNPGLAGCFELAEQAGHAADQIEEFLRGRLRALRPSRPGRS